MSEWTVFRITGKRLDRLAGRKWPRLSFRPDLGRLLDLSLVLVRDRSGTSMEIQVPLPWSRFNCEMTADLLDSFSHSLEAKTAAAGHRTVFKSNSIVFQVDAASARF